MKKIILAAFAVCTLASMEAWAQPSNVCMDSCSVSVPSDTGNTAKRVRQCEPGWGCQCSEQSCHQSYVTGSNCTAGHTFMGYTWDNRKCCHKTNIPCPREGASLEDQVETEIEGMDESHLSDILGADPSVFTGEYFGVVNLINRSPNAGRASALDARLDICMGHGNSPASYPDCLTKCGDGSKNDKCTDVYGGVDNGLCIDRCECKYSQAGCNGL